MAVRAREGVKEERLVAQCLVGNNQPQSMVMPATVFIITCVRLLIHWLILGVAYISPPPVFSFYFFSSSPKVAK